MDLAINNLQRLICYNTKSIQSFNVVAIEKGDLGVTLDYGHQLYLLYLMLMTFNN